MLFCLPTLLHSNVRRFVRCSWCCILKPTWSWWNSFIHRSHETFVLTVIDSDPTNKQPCQTSTSTKLLDLLSKLNLTCFETSNRKQEHNHLITCVRFLYLTFLNLFSTINGILNVFALCSKEVYSDISVLLSIVFG